MKIGLFGGTFDPPHIGHLVIADQALRQLTLDVVWFAPVGQPTHKDNHHVSQAAHRVAMTRLAISDDPRFQLRLDDVVRPPPHYSLTLLESLKAKQPSDEFVFIVGGDSLEDLPNWHRPERLLALTQLAVAHRPGATPDLSHLQKKFPDLRERVMWVDTPLMDLSSTDLRQRVRNGQSIRYLVQHEVEAYIHRNKLYR
jgi:nicotinate-nucleotide adenylyltransferase